MRIPRRHRPAPVRRPGWHNSSSKITAYLQDVRNAYVAYEGAKTPKTTEVTEFGWVANPSSLTYGTEAANQAQNVQIAYAAFRGLPI